MKMKKFTKKELKGFRELLLKAKQKLLKEIEGIEKRTSNSSQKDAAGDLSGYTIHMADLATDSYDRQFSLDIATTEQKIIYEIDDAMHRIESGEYGICVICDKAITRKRLKAVPQAKSCIDCQKKEEAKRRKSR